MTRAHLQLRQITMFPGDTGEPESPPNPPLPLPDANKANQAGDAHEDVYAQLADHQRSETWTHRELVSWLHAWAEAFVFEFKLDVPRLTLIIDPLPVSRLGHYRFGHNGHGLLGEIAVNARYLNVLETWELLGVLLHELLHADEHAHNKQSSGSYHSLDYRRKARSFGLVVDQRGVMGYEESSPFRSLLGRSGIKMPAGAIPPRERRVKGRSKMLKWTCACTTVRCASETLRARCIGCGHTFQRHDDRQKTPPRGDVDSVN